MTSAKPEVVVKLAAEQARVSGDLPAADAERERLERALLALLDATIVEDEAPPHASSEVTAADPWREVENALDRAAWARERERRAEERVAMLRTSLGAARRRPTIGLLMAIDAENLSHAGRTYELLRGQMYCDWELSVCCGADLRESVVDAWLRAGEDGRIRIVSGRGTSDRAIAWNRALATARSEYVAVLDAGDELEATALAEIAYAFLAEPRPDVVYSDECSPGGDSPLLKPGWSPDLLLAGMYVGRLLVARRSLLEAAGRFRAGLGAATEYDMALRVTEAAAVIRHVPEPLVRPAASPATGTADDRTRSAKRALQDALDRRGEHAMLFPGVVHGTFRVKRRLSRLPLVSVIVPFRDRAESVDRCIASLAETAGYGPWEAVLVDNRSAEPETWALLRRFARERLRHRHLSYPAEFNWSAMNDWAADRCDGELLLFLDSGVEALARGWLREMVEHAVRPGIGAVGAHLRRADGSTRHAGIAVFHDGTALRRRPLRGYPGFEGRVRNCSAVTGACMMVRSEVFRRAGGFDPELGEEEADVDFCARLIEAGLGVLYTPYAELVHHDAGMLGRAEVFPHAPSGRRRRGVFADDPYLNPALGDQSAIFTS